MQNEVVMSGSRLKKKKLMLQLKVPEGYFADIFHCENEPITAIMVQGSIKNKELTSLGMLPRAFEELGILSHYRLTSAGPHNTITQGGRYIESKPSQENELRFAERALKQIEDGTFHYHLIIADNDMGVGIISGLLFIKLLSSSEDALQKELAALNEESKTSILDEKTISNLKKHGLDYTKIIQNLISRLPERPRMIINSDRKGFGAKDICDTFDYGYVDNLAGLTDHLNKKGIIFLDKGVLQVENLKKEIAELPIVKKMLSLASKPAEPLTSSSSESSLASSLSPSSSELSLASSLSPNSRDNASDLRSVSIFPVKKAPIVHSRSEGYLLSEKNSVESEFKNNGVSFST
jgi:hypothetical protein